MSKKTEYNNIVCVLQELHKKYPSYNMGRHISTALDEYPDTWGITDKEFLFALEKYAAELDMDVIPDDDEFLKQIQEDALHMFDEKEETEEEDF